MRGPVKALAWVAGILVLLLLVLVVGIKLYVTKERILAWVVPPLEEELQRKVTIADAGAGITGIYLGGLDIRAEGAAQPLVSAGTIRLRWDLLALLSGTVDVKEVALIAPTIHVVRRADGSLDIDDLLAAEKTREATVDAEPEPAAADRGLAVAVALFSMKDGRVSFEDRTRDPVQTYTLDAIESQVREISLTRPFDYELSARLPLTETGRFAATGAVDPVAKSATARIAVKDFSLASLNPVLTGSTRFASGTLGVALDLKAGGGRVEVAGELAVPQLALVSGEAAGTPLDVKLGLAAGADLAADRAEVSSLDLTLGEQVVRMQAKVSALATRPRVDFLVQGDEFAVDPLLALLPEGKAEGGEQAGEAASEPIAVPVDAVGDVKFGTLRAGGLALESFHAHVELLQDKLALRPAGAGLYGGTLDLEAEAGLGSAGPPFEARLGLAEVQVAELLAALNPALANTMTGLVEVKVQAAGAGGDLGALRSRVEAEARNGKLLNHPLVQSFAEMFKVKEYETLNFYSLKADVETAQGTGTVRSLVLNGPNLQAIGKGTVGLGERTLDLRLALAVPKKVAAKLVREQRTLEAITDKDGWARIPMNLKGSLQTPAYGLDAEALAAAAARALGGKAEKQLEEKVLQKVPLDPGQKDAIQKGIKKLFGN